LLNPQAVINDDYICRINEPADKMYFVHSGYIEILCRNGTDPLVYLGKGSYFGEIGVFLTGKRTVSARSKSNSVLYYIEKEELFKLLVEFPEQKNELLEVA
jgi:CRP-like cAMP-binding protein